MMIEINLLPGAKKPIKGGAPALNIGAAFTGFKDKIKDPWLLGSMATVVLAVATVGILFSAQNARASEIEGKLEKAVSDSTRLTSVLSARHKVIAEQHGREARGITHGLFQLPFDFRSACVLQSKGSWKRP